MEHATRFLIRVCAAAVVIAAAVAPARSATPEQVDNAIEKAKAYLYSRQKNGLWEGAPVPMQGEDDKIKSSPSGAQWGGLTSAATYALLAAGESPQDPRLKQAIAFLKQADIIGNYAVGLRCQVWTLLPLDQSVKAAIIRDGNFLGAGIYKTPGDEKAGFYSYFYRNRQLPNGHYDHSVSQYGVLGMWACTQLGYEVDTEYWRIVDKAWRDHQHADGGWAYSGSKPSSDPNANGSRPRASMTAAGIATLFITQEYLYGNAGLDCQGNMEDPNIERGLQWMSEHTDTWLNKDRNNDDNRFFYTLYGIERIGVASGLKYFGTVDWYREGADALIKRQRGDGSWGDSLTDTCFSILFLVRGRAPVVMNKLQYMADSSAQSPRIGNWNQRPRDAANFTKWLSKQTERFLNWQIVNLRVPADELHDAPILYVAGNQDLKFSNEEMDKLRAYVEQGGLILGHADCASSSFEKSFRNLAKKLFPTYEFRELPADHVIYTGQQFNRKTWRSPMNILGLSNGARELMILIPKADPAKSWQTQLYGGKEPQWQAVADIFLYAVDRQNLRNKGETYLVKRQGGSASRTTRVARIEYNGYWDPEPAGWRRLANISHNDHHTDLDLQTVKLGAGKLDNSFPVAHLTGTAKFKLTPDQQAELKKYIQGGGTLIIDAAGGVSDFATAVEAELAAMFPDAKLKTLPADHAVYSAMNAITDVEYRRFAKRVVGNSKNPRMKCLEIDGRPAVFYSPEDLSVGMVGQPVDGIYGYDPKWAAQLMENLVTFAAKK